MKEAKFVIVAHGGSLKKTYVSEAVFRSDDPDFEDFMDDEPGAGFEEWCDEQCRELAYDLEQHGASVLVLPLEEYRTLPKL